MSNQFPPWAGQANYPTSPSAAWAGTPTKVVPAYTFFTPGQAPAAQELNAILNQIGVGMNAVGSTAAEIAAANFNKIDTSPTQGGNPYATYGIAFDHDGAQWVAALDNATPVPTLYTSQDGLLFVPNTSFAALSGPTNAPRALGMFPLTGTAAVYCSNGATGVMQRCTQSGAPATTATGQAWAVRSATLCNQGTMVFFWGANNPGMFFFGANSFQSRAAWNGFAAFDSSNNDGAGTAGVWTDLHTSLPAAFLSGNSYIHKYETAQSANLLAVAMCGRITGTDPSFLMKVDVAGAMTDITPAFVGGLSRSIRGLAYSATDGLWGLLSVDSGSNTYLDVSPDLTNWTNVWSLPEAGIGMAVIRNTWSIVVSMPWSAAADRCIYVSNVAQVYANPATTVPRIFFANYPAVSNTHLANGVFTLQSSELPPGAPASVVDIYPKAPQFIASTLFNATCAFSQSLRAGHYDTQQSGVVLQPISLGWNTALDMDFSTLGNATFAADGAISLGGYNWTKASSANDRAALANINGTGLRWQPNTGAIGSSIFLPLQSFVPVNALLWSTSFRIWMYVKAQNLSGVGDSMLCQIKTTTAVGGWTAGMTMVAGPTPAMYAHGVGGSALTQTLGAGNFNNNNAIVLDVLGLKHNIASNISGQYSGGAWPTEPGALYESVTVDNGSLTLQDPSSSANSVAFFGIVFFPVAISAGITIDIGRVRVDFKL